MPTLNSSIGTLIKGLSTVCCPGKAALSRFPFMLTRPSESGDLLWSRLFFFKGNPQFPSTARHIMADREGDVVAVGYSVTSETSADKNVLLIKANHDGIIQ